MFNIPKQSKVNYSMNATNWFDFYLKIYSIMVRKSNIHQKDIYQIE